MEKDDYTVSNAPSTANYFSSVRWKDGALCGLIMGLILFFLNRGLPWIGSGAIDPAVMGREVAPGRDITSGLFLGTLAVHLGLAGIYGLILAALVQRMEAVRAGLIGAIMGIVFYFLDTALFGSNAVSGGASGNWSSILMHVVFGFMTAEAYKGLTRKMWMGGTA